MLVSCKYCGSTHKRGHTCIKKPIYKSKTKKEYNDIRKFRSSRIWQKKRDEIKHRDKYLCRNCLNDGILNFQKLEVHHIDAISNNWNSRLDSNNLITLCSSCHKSAENGNIQNTLLKNLILERVVLKNHF